MKHIKRKFLFHDVLQNKIPDKFKQVDIKEFDQSFLKRVSKEHVAIVETELGKKNFSFIYNNNVIHCIATIRF